LALLRSEGTEQDRCIDRSAVKLGAVLPIHRIGAHSAWAGRRKAPAGGRGRKTAAVAQERFHPEWGLGRINRIYGISISFWW